MEYHNILHYFCGNNMKRVSYVLAQGTKKLEPLLNTKSIKQTKETEYERNIFLTACFM